MVHFPAFIASFVLRFYQRPWKGWGQEAHFLDNITSAAKVYMAHRTEIGDDPSQPASTFLFRPCCKGLCWDVTSSWTHMDSYGLIIWTHRCMCVCVYVCIYLSIDLSIYVSMYLCMYVSMYVRTYVRMYVCMLTAHTYIHIINIYIYVYIYT